MATIKIILTQQVEKEIEIPSFWKDVVGGKKEEDQVREFVGLLDEETLVRVWRSNDRTFIENVTLDGREADIAKYEQKYEKSDEVDFLLEFNKAYKSLSLVPQLLPGDLVIDTGRDEAIKDYERNNS